MVVNLGEQSMTLIKRVFADGWSSIGGLVVGFGSMLAPAVPAALTAYLFIFADLYYGYKVSKKFGHKHVESHKVWKTINKVTEATVLIFLALMLDKFIFMTPDQLYAVKIAAGSICFAEGLSLLESLRALHPKAMLSKILSKIVKSKAEKYLEVDISDIIDEENKQGNDTNNK